MFTLITLYSTIIPISLYVSIEVCVAAIYIPYECHRLDEGEILFLDIVSDDQIYSVHSIYQQGLAHVPL